MKIAVKKALYNLQTIAVMHAFQKMADTIDFCPHF